MIIVTSFYCGEWNSYLDTKGEHISKSGERFGRVQTLECRIDHSVQSVNVMKLGGRPPHE